MGQEGTGALGSQRLTVEKGSSFDKVIFDGPGGQLEPMFLHRTQQRIIWGEQRVAPNLSPNGNLTPAGMDHG